MALPTDEVGAPTTNPTSGRVLVLGASGYVGGRLVPDLLADGLTVRCLTRSHASLASIQWGSEVEIFEGDLEQPDSLGDVFRDVDTVVYLVHSLHRDDFETVEQTTARNVADACATAGVRHIVYMSGLGDDDEELSAHLRSRHAVGATLAAGTTPVTELRAAVVLGAGSASFEMLRSLVEVLPAMVAPAWVTRTRVQPIAITDVLRYLDAAITAGPADHHRIVEIGGPDQLTYADLIKAYADAAGLRRRLIIPIPFVSPTFSTHWVNLVTPLPRTLAASLIDSLRNDVVVTDDSAATLSDHVTKSTRTAIESSITRVKEFDIPTRWSGIGLRDGAATPKPWDPEWSGGTVYEDTRSTDVDAEPRAVQRVLHGIGGDRGWYGFRHLWAIRGVMDKMVGGVGLRRGRRHPDEISVGEALDFWRVEAIEPDMFRLRAEMKLPGEAWLEWTTESVGDGRTRLTQRARFVPRGILGRAYWWSMLPFHASIFPIMVRRIGRACLRTP
jgi:uncharacterized protein YbjT (DUF2867 family)